MCGKYESLLANIIPLFKGDTNHFNVNEEECGIVRITNTIFTKKPLTNSSQGAIIIFAW